MKANSFIIVLIMAILAACTQTDPNEVTISGKISNPLEETASFVLDDTSYTSTLSEDGTFEVNFTLDSATYITFGHGTEVTAMYVKPGDRISLTLDPEQFDETIAYEGSIHCSFLAEKYLFNEGYDFFGEIYYLGSEEEYKAFTDEYKSHLHSKLDLIGDSAFRKSEMDDINNDVSYYLQRHQRFLGQYADHDRDVREFVMKRTRLNQDYDFYGGLTELDSQEYAALLESFSTEVEDLLGTVNDKEFIEKERQSRDEQVRIWGERKAMTDNMPKAGEPAKDFSYPDIDGNEISLSSFKGKLVYVDVWATWCGPCLGEIPSLQKLEADYHAKEIVFLSVSVDTRKADWEKMVTEDHLGGVQIWADGWSQITKDYAIFGIPRFLLIAADGTMISNDAPRPSSDGIRELLDSNL